jgi:exopolysaccharide production protein ExoQ
MLCPIRGIRTRIATTGWQKQSRHWSGLTLNKANRGLGGHDSSGTSAVSDFSAPRSTIRNGRVVRRFAIPLSSVNIGMVVILLLAANGALYRFGAATGIVWSLATAICVLWFLRSPRMMSNLLARHWALLLLPLFAILSTVWSGARAFTLFDSVQMLFTAIISLRIVQVFSTRQLMIALLISLGGATILSVLNMLSGALQPVYEVNGALLGIFTQKNNFAKAVFWGAFAATALSLMHGKPLIGVIVSALTFPLTLMALSKTGQLGYGFILLLLLLAAMRQLPIRTRIMLPLLLGTTFFSLIAVYVATGGAPIGDFLMLMGKSPTLTGRTVIWGLGIEVWRENILVGIGLNTFWNSPAYADAVNFIAANVDDGLHGFHNVYVEYLVAFGIIGGGYTIGLLVFAWGRLLRAYLLTRSLDLAVWLAIMSALIVFGGFEDSFSKPRSGHLMLAFMAISYAQTTARQLREGRFR